MHEREENEGVAVQKVKLTIMEMVTSSAVRSFLPKSLVIYNVQTGRQEAQEEEELGLDEGSSWFLTAVFCS